MTTIGELDSVSKVLAAFYRMTGNTTSDPSLVARGEAADETAYQLLTRGCRVAQDWMLQCGYVGWRKRSSALSWSGTDAADGGRYSALPTRFMQAYAPRDAWGLRTCLVQANGDRWGTQITPDERHLEGDFYYFFNTDGTDQIWLARNANPPATVYMNYIEAHDAWNTGVTISFPLECRHLIVSEAASLGMDESWFPAGPELQQSIQRALERDREHARDVARQTKAPRVIRRPARFGNF